MAVRAGLSQKTARTSRPADTLEGEHVSNYHHSSSLIVYNGRERDPAQQTQIRHHDRGVFQYDVTR